MCPLCFDKTLWEVKSLPRPVGEVLKAEPFANTAWKAFFPILGVAWLAHFTQHFPHLKGFDLGMMSEDNFARFFCDYELVL